MHFSIQKFPEPLECDFGDKTKSFRVEEAFLGQGFTTMPLPVWSVPPPLWLQLGIEALWLGTVGLTAECLYRFKLASSEIVRKVVHIGAGHVIVLAWWLQIPAWVGISASLVFSAIAVCSYYLPLLPSINSVGRQSWGTFFYALSIGLLIAWFWPLHKIYFAVLGVMVMAWGDGLAALVGQRLGRHPYTAWGIQKSWEGSLTMAIASFVVSSVILGSVHSGSWATVAPIAAAIALSATGLEACSKYGIDNLTVPLGSAAVGLGLETWFGPI